MIGFEKTNPTPEAVLENVELGMGPRFRDSTGARRLMRRCGEVLGCEEAIVDVTGVIRIEATRQSGVTQGLHGIDGDPWPGGQISD